MKGPVLLLAAGGLLAGCEREVIVSKEAVAPGVVEKGPAAVRTAERLVRARLDGGEAEIAETAIYDSGGVTVVCGDYRAAGADPARFIAVGGEFAFLEPNMEPGEMDRAFAEFCRDA